MKRAESPAAPAGRRRAHRQEGLGGGAQRLRAGRQRAARAAGRGRAAGRALAQRLRRLQVRAHKALLPARAPRLTPCPPAAQRPRCAGGT
jgi:hypothetical protein